MGYDYYYHSSLMGAIIIAAIIIGIVAAIVLHFTFLSNKNNGKYTGFLGWMYDFLSFKKLILEDLLKIIYLICTCCVTLLGIVMLFSSFIAGLLILVLGNLFLRISYEFSIMIVLICKNITQINSKLK